ncbi:MAG: hypothetical protein KA257_10030 [Opitutaceae bacterium]|nr:hypothetical protein [Opitutaceae bacterium]MBP9912175.1 hypothetical protein [Opitutaceae bacterium]
MKVLVALLSLFIASGALAGENLTADQIWERRAELDKKTVRASFEWHYNFEASDAHVWMPDGTVRSLRVEFAGGQLSQSAPAEWKKVEDAFRSYGAQMKRAAQKKKEGPKDLWFVVDADVEVSLPPPQKDPDVIVLGPDLFLRVTALHSVRKEEANSEGSDSPERESGPRLNKP